MFGKMNKYAEFDLPCTDPDRMDDWFIGERPQLEPEERALLEQQAIKSFTEYKVPSAEDELERLVAERIADLKLRRRRAIQSCYFDCPMRARLLCLDDGLKPGNQEHGIMGGYPESERRDIVKAIKARTDKMGTMKAAKVILSEERKAALNQLPE